MLYRYTLFSVRPKYPGIQHPFSDILNDYIPLYTQKKDIPKIPLDPNPQVAPNCVWSTIASFSPHDLSIKSLAKSRDDEIHNQMSPSCPFLIVNPMKIS